MLRLWKIGFIKMENGKAFFDAYTIKEVKNDGRN